MIFDDNQIMKQIIEKSGSIIEQGEHLSCLLYMQIDIFSDNNIFSEIQEKTETQQKLGTICHAVERLIEFANAVTRIINKLYTTDKSEGLFINISDNLHDMVKIAREQVVIIEHNVKIPEESNQISRCLDTVSSYKQQVKEFIYYLYDVISYLNKQSQEYMASCEVSSTQFCCFERMEKSYNLDNLDKSDNSKAPKLSEVQFSAIVPKNVKKDDYLLISIYMYEESFRAAVEEAINNDSNVKEHKSGFFSVQDNTKVKIVLSSPDLEYSDEEILSWQGKYLTFDFALSIPESLSKNKILCIASVYFNDILTTKLKFVVVVDSLEETKLQISRKDILSAFISYARQDRSRVASIIQGMKKARPDLDIFFDVESLRSGEKWEDVLKKEIDERDVLYLFWSHFASESEWVNMEWRYALEKKGIDFIEPVPIESPENCPPPKELNIKHFNDIELLYYQTS